MIIIRNAEINDIEGIIDVNTRTWRTTYTGIIDEKYLSEREANREKRIKKMMDSFDNEQVDGEKVCQCVADDNGNVIGFAGYGSCRETETYGLKDAGEIYAIYVSKEYQGQGIGKRLVNFSVQQLIEKNYNKAVIWALKDNPCIGFYESIGGTRRFERNIEIGSQTLIEVGFVFEDLKRLFKDTKA